MFRVRDLSVKVSTEAEMAVPLFACGSTGCNVCDSTPGIPMLATASGAQNVSLPLLRQQLRHELAHLN